MNIEVITSFNQKYYDLIGSHALESFLRFWPPELKITCYVEEMTIPDQNRVIRFNRQRIVEIGFDQLPPDYWHLQNSEVKDRVKTFGKKAWSFIHAMHQTTADWLLWLDADVLTTKPITHQLLAQILPSSALATYMGVTYTETKDGIVGNWLVPETGVFAVNCQHAEFEHLRNQYQQRYVNMDSTGLRRFYDNDVFGAVVRSVSAEYNDLCKHIDKPYKTPLRHTVLGDYLHHYKAKHSKDHFAQLWLDQ